MNKQNVGQNHFYDLDIDKLRTDTPGCEQLIHLNNAGAALPSRSTLDAIKNYLDREALMGGYEAAVQTQEHIDAVYSSVSTLIGANSDEIALKNSATDAWNTIFYSLNFEPGDQIFTSRSEYASNFMALLQQANRYGVSIEIIPDNDHGEIDLEELQTRLNDKVRLVCLTHIPTNCGLVNPAEKIGEMLKTHPSYYMLDACQSIGQIQIDVKRIACDFLTATGRKYLRAPRGTGFLYIRKALIDEIEPAQIDIRGASWDATYHYQFGKDARNYESWEASHALRLGLKAAVDTALDLGMPNIEKRINYLAERLRKQLSDIPGVTIRDKGSRQCGIVTFDMTDQPASAVVPQLRAYGINTALSPVSMARLDMEPRGLDEVIRASVHYYNTEQELDRFCERIESLS